MNLYMYYNEQQNQEGGCIGIKQITFSYVSKILRKHHDLHFKIC